MAMKDDHRWAVDFSVQVNPGGVNSFPCQPIPWIPDSDASFNRVADGSAPSQEDNDQIAIVKNTFIGTVDVGSWNESLRRSHSDSDLSRSSGDDKMKFWLPSLSSESSSSTSGRNKDMMHRREGYPFQQFQSQPLAGKVADQCAGVTAESVRDGRQAEFAPHQFIQTGTAPSVRSGISALAPPQQRGQDLKASNGPTTVIPGAEMGWEGQAIRDHGVGVVGLPSSRTSYGYGDHLPPGRRLDAGLCGIGNSSGSSQGLVEQMPRNSRGEVPSIGSLKHATGECAPCLFWFRKSCAKGIHCDYCHIRHKGQRNKRIRPSKKTRMQIRAATDSQDQDQNGMGDNDYDDYDDDDVATANYFPAPEGCYGQGQQQALTHRMHV